MTDTTIETPQHDSDDEERVLCSDGACTGLVDPKTGRCKECGRAADGSAPEPAPALETSTAGDDDDDRILCPDGACTGLVDPQTRRCKECGTSLDSQAS